LCPFWEEPEQLRLAEDRMILTISLWLVSIATAGRQTGRWLWTLTLEKVPLFSPRQDDWHEHFMVG